MFRSAVIFCSLFFSLLSVVEGRETPPVDRTSDIPDAEIERLSATSMWRRLNGFHGRRYDLPGGRSDIVNADYFLSARGQHDPQAELRATIEALQSAAPEDPNAHASCLYPARTLWLERELGERLDAVEVECADFVKWRGEEKPVAASFVFASGFLGNPGSFFGHVILRFKSGSELREKRSELLAPALNHGADYPENANMLAYMAKGVSGLYRSRYSMVAYSELRRRYAEEELRDIWEYELNLNPFEVDLLVAHTYERLRIQNRYYFFRQNCAYRLAEIIEVAIDQDIVSRVKPTVLPADILLRLAEVEVTDGPLVRRVRETPSRQKVFRKRYLRLGLKERSIVRSLISDEGADLDEKVRSLDGDRRTEVLDTLIEYIKTDDNVDRLPSGITKGAVLATRILLPPSPELGLEDAQKKPPHAGQRTTLFQASGLYNSEFGPGARIRLRATYYDFLTVSEATLPNSEMAFLDVNVDLFEAVTRIKRIDIVRIATLGLSPTGLPGDRSLAWRVRFGAEAESLACERCVQGFVDGGVGKGAYLTNSLVGYAFADLRINSNADFDGYGAAGLSGGLVADFGPHVRGRMEVGGRQDFGGDGKIRPIGALELRFGSADRWDVRLASEYERIDATSSFEMQLGIGFYF